MMNYQVIWNAPPAMCSHPPMQMMSPMIISQHRLPRAIVGNGDGGVERELNEQLVASLKNVAPALQSLQQESQAAAKRHEALSEAAAKRHEALSEATVAYMKLQVEMLGKMNDKLDSHETRLQKVEERQKEADEHVARFKKVEKRQKEADEHVARLKKVEALLEQRQAPPPPPSEKRAPFAFASAPSKVHKLRMRAHREPTGWCKLSGPARELLRRTALKRLEAGYGIFYGALGTHSVQHILRLGTVSLLPFDPCWHYLTNYFSPSRFFN